MHHRPLVSLLLGAALLPPSAGCLLASKSDLDAAQTQNRVLREQTRAQLAEIENVQSHTRKTENQLATAEQRLAALEDQLTLSNKQLANFEHERGELHDQVQGLANAHLPISPDAGRRVAAVCERFPSLRFDPHTGVARLEVDILFDTGRTELKSGASQILGELVRALKTPEGQDLRVLVVGHTDDRAIARKPARDQFGSNLDLSTARAESVADQLRKLGLEPARLGVAGFGPNEPIAPNVTLADRQKNRRVEVFVVAPEVPVVGWTDTMPNLY